MYGELSKIHNHKYVYNTKVRIINQEKLRLHITCKLHGVFLLQFKTHKNGVGCPECSGTIPFYIKEYTPQ